MKRWLLLILALAFIPSLVARAALQPEMIRVAISKGVEVLRVDGAGILATDGKGDPLRLSYPLEVRRTREGLSVNGRHVGSLVASAPVYVLVNGKRYRGTIECLPDAKGILVVNELPLEEYLVGLINSEISSQWPIEAVKAQAVIARSYAVYQKGTRRNPLYDLESSIMDQVYDGSDSEDSRAARGVEETAGEILTYNGNVIRAFYHSNCGGHTEAAENVWGSSLPYLKGVECRYCTTAPSARWEQVLPLSRIETQLNAAGIPGAGIKEIVSGSRNRSGRLGEVILVTSRGRQVVPAGKFRMAVGSTIIKSTNFEVRTSAENASFSGNGYGHGVGLCQWGSKQRAADGFDYREILSYYYPGVRMSRLTAD
ncbi:SpoIID/LytB domain-containing protein [Geobacter sp. DSM 9736]|uniref:SpoIID/LytB domain-containing protein n=1 Tax=Geobacter sp. DSM 9736 TaxID=1277350 RepID=UPI000B60099B|nr:SpoIID/LytB domain-containing protein [Geobacter sp. DSM 9736]SNB44835.1 stage II sporulation protein D [Geobacter sp. DSM 9736]